MYVNTSYTGPRRSYQRRPSPAVRFILVPRGMGDLSPQNQTIAAAAAAGASTTVSMLVAMGTIGGPVGAAIAGVISIGMALAKVFGGCGQTCVQASNIANQVEPLLQQNVNHYLSAPVRYASLQAAAVNNFQTAWNALVQNCSNPALQAAGQRCISDRQQSGCTWKTSPGGWTQDSAGNWSYVPAGPAGSGSTCWNWFVGYLDPIVNDPTVVPDPIPGSSSGSGLLTSFGIDPATTVAGIPVSDLVIPAAVLLALVALS
jgi:hypothetical protein